MRPYRFIPWALYSGIVFFGSMIVSNAIEGMAFFAWFVWTSCYVFVVVKEFRHAKAKESWPLKNCCHHCGYPLEGLRDFNGKMTGECPECGYPFS